MKDIFSAIELGDKGLVAAIISQEPSSLKRVFDHEIPDQPLHIAAQLNQVDIGELLIDLGADINAKGRHNWTPLHIAAYEGSVDIAHILIRKGADINAGDENNCTPLFFAVRGRDPECDEIAELLLANGAKVDLNIAVCLGSLQLATEVLASNSLAVEDAPFPDDLLYDAVLAVDYRTFQSAELMSVSDKEEQLRTSLVPLLELLIAHGANVNSIGTSGMSALSLATSLQNRVAIDFLRVHGALER